MQEEENQEQASAEQPRTSATKGSQISRKFSVAVCLLVLLSMCVFWLISNYNTQNLLRQQADLLGQTLAQQTATLLTELVLANDLISMNVVLGNLTRNSSIAEVAVLNVSNEIIAIASGTQSTATTVVPMPIPLNRVQGEYLAPIALADSVAGYVRLRLDLNYIEIGMVNNLLYISAATVLLLIIAAVLTTTYFRYLVSFPANLLAYSLSNIRKGEIETCPEPDNTNEISAAIRQFNATAEFLAQNTFLSNFGHTKPDAVTQESQNIPGTHDVTLLSIKMANFHYLASTLDGVLLANLLNKYYFYAGKVCQLYNGQVSYCAEDEVVMSFSNAAIEEDQAFYAICAGQLFLQLVTDLNDIEGKQVAAKFKLVAHSGQMLSGLYSPITQDNSNLSGKALDSTRSICTECPDNSLLISEPCYAYAGADTRIDAEEFSLADDELELIIYLSNQPLSDYKLLIERQAQQLLALYAS